MQKEKRAYEKVTMMQHDEGMIFVVACLRTRRSLLRFCTTLPFKAVNLILVTFYFVIHDSDGESDRTRLIRK
jgi:hypothetical protein